MATGAKDRKKKDDPETALVMRSYRFSPDTLDELRMLSEVVSENMGTPQSASAVIRILIHSAAKRVVAGKPPLCGA